MVEYALSNKLFMKIKQPYCKECGSYTGEILPGKGPHIAKLVCYDCKAFRGWLPSTVNFVGGNDAA